MAPVAESWATQQLTELLAAVQLVGSREEAVRVAIEHAGKAVEAEVVALVSAETVEAAVGFAEGKVPEPELIRAAARGDSEIVVNSSGPLSLHTVQVGEGDGAARMLVGRAGDDDFTREESELLHAMGRTLDLALEQVELIRRLREREDLLERVSRMQRSITRHDDVQRVFDAAVRGSAELFGEPFATLCLIDEDDSQLLRTVAVHGLGSEVAGEIERVSLEGTIVGRAISRGQVEQVPVYADDPGMCPALAGRGVRAAMIAPIVLSQRSAGAIVIGSDTENRTFSEYEVEALVAIAETTGLALNDAKQVADANWRALHDALTDLPNRRLLADRIRGAGMRARISGEQTAVLFCDVDGFKTVNDSLGHEAGDELLVAVAARLRAAVEPTDSVARIGGDEFAVLVERIAEPIEAGRVAQRILDALALPFTVAGREVLLGASIGIAVGTDEPEEMVRNADLAMYEAKGRGKGRYEIFQKEMHDAMSARLELEQDLKRAVLFDQLVLNFQPLIDLESGRVDAVEALVRWQHPDRGLISPLEFIPLAEETGQIYEIGRWVLEQACSVAARWRDAHDQLELNVNLSGLQLRRPALVGELEAVLEHTGFDPSALVLEITESSLMDSTIANVERLDALKALGVKLAIDDFGTGYSSLQYLRRFPIDILKVAKPFVEGVERSRGERGLVRAIVDVAHSLDLGVIAEGIESSGQAAELLCLGCSRGQGFFFSPPLTITDLTTVLSAGRNLVLRPALRPATA